MNNDIVQIQQKYGNLSIEEILNKLVTSESPEEQKEIEKYFSALKKYNLIQYMFKMIEITSTKKYSIPMRQSAALKVKNVFEKEEMTFNWNQIDDNIRTNIHKQLLRIISEEEQQNEFHSIVACIISFIGIIDLSNNKWNDLFDELLKDTTFGKMFIQFNC